MRGSVGVRRLVRAFPQPTRERSAEFQLCALASFVPAEQELRAPVNSRRKNLFSAARVVKHLAA